ncbi:MAG: protein kinase [Candidatus Brocadiia bacterium]
MLRIRTVGTSSTQIVDLGEGDFTIGSAPDCSIRISSVPSKLIAVTVRKGVASFKAESPVDHNGRSVKEGKLRAGDILIASGVKFILEEATSAASSGATIQMPTDGKTVNMTASELPGIPPVLTAQILSAVKELEIAGQADQVKHLAGEFEKTTTLPGMSLAAILKALDMLDGGAKNESLVKAALAKNEGIRRRVEDLYSAQTGSFQAGASPVEMKTSVIGSGDATRSVGAPGDLDIFGDKKTEGFRQMIDREVSARTSTTAIGEQRKESVLRALENMGIVQEELKNRAIEVSRREDGLTTAELLVNLGLLSPEAIDVKPSKQFAGIRPQLEGKVLGDYRLVKELGSGGFGIVYRADSLIDKKVYAIKVLFKEYSDDITQLAIFARESKTAKQFEHKNILKVFGLEKFRDTYYMITEFVEGGDLFGVIRKQKKLGWKDIATYGAKICDGLQYAAFPPGSFRGIIHRDIKPQNILLSKDGEPKLADFGLAKFEEGSAETVVYQTTEAMIFKGTVAYAAPERFAGNKDIDHRSDIYSLGVMFYEMATGRLPFEGMGVSELILAHMNMKPVAPKMLNPDIPLVLENLILKCMQKKPEQRYANAGEVAAEFRKMLANEQSIGNFSLAEQWKSLSLSATVAIPDRLPSNLPLRIRMKYFLMRPRPRFWRTAAISAAIVVLGIAALILLPIIVEARAMSRANAYLADFNYDEAITELSGVVEKSPDNRGAADLLKRTKDKVVSLREVLLPRIAQEKRSPSPNTEKIYGAAQQAFEITPMDDNLAGTFVDSGISSASLRMDRGEFQAASELLTFLRESLTRLPNPRKTEYVARLDDFLKIRNPETLEIQTADLARKAVEEEKVLRNTDGLFTGDGSTRAVASGKLDALLASVTRISAIYSRMAEISPKNLSVLLEGSAYSRLNGSFAAGVAADRQGAESRLARMLSMMRVEQEMRERKLAALLEIYDLWKQQTPFEEIIRVAREFSDPSDLDKARLALQLCQIVLSITPDEKAALSALDGLVGKLTSTFDASSPDLATIDLAGVAILTQYRYAPEAGLKAGRASLSVFEAMLPRWVGTVRFIALWRSYRSLGIAVGEAKAAGALACFQKSMIPHFTSLIRGTDREGAASALDSILADSAFAPQAGEFCNSTMAATTEVIATSPAFADRFVSDFIARAKTATGEFSDAVRRNLAPFEKLKIGLAIYAQARGIISDGTATEDDLRRARTMLLALKTDAFPGASLDADMARLDDFLKNFGVNRQVSQFRAEFFVLLGKEDFAGARKAITQAADLAGAARPDISVLRNAMAAFVDADGMDPAEAVAGMEKAVDAVKTVVLDTDAERAVWSRFIEAFQNKLLLLRKKAADAAQAKDRSAEAKRMVEQADKLFEAGDFSGALTLYQKADELVPSAETKAKMDAAAKMMGYKGLMKKAEEALAKGDYLAAEEFCKQAQLSSDTAEVRSLLDKCRRYKVYAESFAEGSKALAEDRLDDAVRLLALALENAPDGKREEVQGLLARAKVRKFVSDGNVAFKAGDFRKAQGSYSLATAIAPDSEALIRIGVCILEITALPDVKENELIDARTGRSQVLVALDCIRSGREGIANAAESRKKELAILADRSEALALYAVYTIEHSQAMLKRALELIDSAIAADPKSVDARIDKAGILMAMRDVEGCLKVINEGLALDPANPLLQRHLGSVLFAQGKLDEAEAAYKKCIAGNSRDSLVYLGLGNIYKAQQRLKEAEAAILKSLEISPLLAEAHNNLAWLYSTTTDPGFRKPKEAIEHALTACRLTAYSNPDWLDTLAHAYAADDNLAKAVEVEAKALEIAPDRTDIADYLVELKRKAGGK